MTQEEFYTIEEDLIIGPNYIMGTADDYSIDDDEQRIIRLKLVIPKKFFEPLGVEIRLPEDFLNEPDVKIEEITVPISVTNEEEVDRVLECKLEEGSGDGILAYLKKKLFY